MPLRTDDSTIKNDHWLLRRLIYAWVVSGENGPRVSSAAFKDALREVSVDLRHLVEGDPLTSTPEHLGLAEIQASVPRSLGHAVVHDPEFKATNPKLEADNPAHALICEPPDRPKKSRLRDAKEMANQAKILKRPPR